MLPKADFLQTAVGWMSLRHRKIFRASGKPALDSIFSPSQGLWRLGQSDSSLDELGSHVVSGTQLGLTLSITHWAETCMPSGRPDRNHPSRGLALSSSFPSCCILIGTMTFDPLASRMEASYTIFASLCFINFNNLSVIWGLYIYISIEIWKLVLYFKTERKLCTTLVEDSHLDW